MDQYPKKSLFKKIQHNKRNSTDLSQKNNMAPCKRLNCGKKINEESFERQITQQLNQQQIKDKINLNRSTFIPRISRNPQLRNKNAYTKSIVLDQSQLKLCANELRLKHIFGTINPLEIEQENKFINFISNHLEIDKIYQHLQQPQEKQISINNEISKPILKYDTNIQNNQMLKEIQNLTLIKKQNQTPNQNAYDINNQYQNNNLHQNNKQFLQNFYSPKNCQEFKNNFQQNKFYHFNNFIKDYYHHQQIQTIKNQFSYLPQQQQTNGQQQFIIKQKRKKSNETLIIQQKSGLWSQFGEKVLFTLWQSFYPYLQTNQNNKMQKKKYKLINGQNKFNKQKQWNINNDKKYRILDFEFENIWKNINLKQIQQADLPKISGFKISPKISVLSKFTKPEIQSLYNFQIQNQYGKIKFKDSISVFQKNLKDSILIEQNYIEILEEQWKHKRYSLLFKNVKDYVNQTYEQQQRIKKKTKKFISKLGLKFIKFDGIKGDLYAQI